MPWVQVLQGVKFFFLLLSQKKLDFGSVLIFNFFLLFLPFELKQGFSSKGRKFNLPSKFFVERAKTELTQKEKNV